MKQLVLKDFKLFKFMNLVTIFICMVGLVKKYFL